MKKGNLFNTIAFIFSIMLLIVSGAIYVYSAQQQSASSSLSVTFSGKNVNFEAQGWYHVHGGSRTAMVNSQGGNTVSFSVTETSVEKTLKISNTEAENKAVLTSVHPYVLFTYKFVNTASSGAFGMGVSLNITPTPTNLKTITYASSTSLYTEADLDTFKATVTGTSTFSSDTIAAGGTSGATSGNSVKYYYILLEVDDLTLPVDFTPTFSWDVGCAIPPSPAEWFRTFDGVCVGLTSAWESSSDPNKNDLVLPSTITTIPDEAFCDISSLRSITIPSSVTSIGGGAFYWCSSLESITISSSVTSIGEGAFAGSSSLESITVDTNNTAYKSVDNCLLNKAGTTLLLGCKNSIIPSSVTSIGYEAFSECTSLTSITIPNGVTSIGDYAFDGCSALTSISIPNSVTSIGYWAFSGCNNQAFTIYKNAKYLGNSGNPHLVLVYGPNDESITSCEISEYCKLIVPHAFDGCTSLESITIPSSVTSIGSSAFYDCSSLTSISIPNGVTSIGYEAFSGCSALTSISIPNSVTSIGNSAFRNCTSLTSITIPSSVTSIGDYAFDGCTNLTSVTFENTSGWQMSSDASFSNPSNINVSTPATNATNLKSYSGAWGNKYLRKVSV